jgi:RHS repeat-associated protein
MVLTVRQDSHRLSHVLHRSAADLTAIANSTPDGFTGHAMLDGVGLIHMAGRVYDPTVGRFLSVDPLVRDAAASQSWNGYGYVEGRVLSATDPSGWQTVDCPQCVRYRADPPRSAMEVVVVTARRWDPLSINLDRLGLLDLSRGLGRAEMPSQTVNEEAETEEPRTENRDRQVQCLPDDPPIEPICPECYLLGAGRLAYAGFARLIPAIGASVEESAMGQAAYAVAARNSLKDLFRGPLAPALSGVRQPTFSASLVKYDLNPYAIINAASRTNAAVNLAGATGAALGIGLGVANQQRCGPGQRP